MVDRSKWAPTPLQCVMLDRQEFREREDARRAAVQAWPGYSEMGGVWPDELSALSRSFIPPGSMWECPWYFDPKDPADLAKLDVWLANAVADPTGNRHLSVHYLQDWAKIRPPICVVTPDHGHWIVDAKSSNGTGWTITGTAPRLTASPSIWSGVAGPNDYHGWLRDGVFSAPV